MLSNTTESTTVGEREQEQAGTRCCSEALLKIPVQLLWLRFAHGPGICQGPSGSVPPWPRTPIVEEKGTHGAVWFWATDRKLVGQG